MTASVPCTSGSRTIPGTSPMALIAEFGLSLEAMS